MQIKLTPARERALRKAAERGFIFKPGSFCPENALMQEEAIERKDFDTIAMIDTLLEGGLLEYGEGFGQYRLTERGRLALEEKVSNG